ncbi:MAG: hypothetical protein M5U34_38675 [Chloroflexi bacterium]|nr:hypothetical protein [Chloroflexota bacterium]
MWAAHRPAGLVLSLPRLLRPGNAHVCPAGAGGGIAGLCLCRAWLNGRWQWWLLMGVLGAVTLYAHNLGAMFIAALDLWVLWQWLRARRPLHWQGLLLAHLTMLLLFAPWLAILPAQLGKIQQSYWVQQPGVVELLQTTLIFHFAYDNQALSSWLLPLAFAFSLFIPAVLVLEWRRHKRIKLAYSETFPHALSLLLFLVIGPILLTFLISQIRPVYIARALLPSAAIYLLLVVAVLSQRQTPRPIKWGLALPSLLIMLLALWNHYTYVDFPRSTFAEAAFFANGSQSHYRRHRPQQQTHLLPGPLLRPPTADALYRRCAGQPGRYAGPAHPKGVRLVCGGGFGNGRFPGPRRLVCHLPASPG